MRIGIGRLGAYVVTEPGLVRQMLVHDKVFDKGGFVYDASRAVVGNGLGACPHSMHRRQRRLIQPAFHHGRHPGYADVTTAQALAVVESWQDGHVVDVVEQMSEVTTRVTVATMFSDTAGSGLLAEIVADSSVLFQAAFLALLPFPSRAKRRFRRAKVNVRRNAGEVIARYRAAGVDRGDLLSMLLTSHDEDALSDEEILEQVTTFIIAGVETSANVLMWALHELTRHPEVEARVQEEVDRVLAGRPGTLDDVPRLDVTTRLINETMRMYPPLWLMTRETTEPAQLGEHRLPAGATVIFSPYLQHHRPDLFDDPERFDIDRAAPPRGALIPFGGGARKCVADTYALTECVLVLAAVVARWRLEAVAGQQVRASLGASLRPRELRLVARKRQTFASTSCSNAS